MTIGIDIGGTNIKGVLLARRSSKSEGGLKDSKIVAKIRVPIKSRSNKKLIISQIFDCLDYLMKNRKKVKGIGIGVPSPIDFKNQKILNPPNVPALKNLYLGKVIKDKFKIKTIIDNDVHCLVGGEAILGAGKNKKIVVGLGLGTGVGGGIVMDKKIFRGQRGTSGEIGHMMIRKDGRECRCGARGCLEAYVNEKGIRKTAKEIFGREIGSISLFKMAEKGNKKAIKVWEITGRYLGLGLANLVDIFNPEIIVIGGGIANAREFLIGPAKEEMKKNILSPIAKNTPVVRAKLGEWAGAIGAGLLL